MWATFAVISNLVIYCCEHEISSSFLATRFRFNCALFGTIHFHFAHARVKRIFLCQVYRKMLFFRIWPRSSGRQSIKQRRQDEKLAFIQCLQCVGGICNFINNCASKFKITTLLMKCSRLIASNSSDRGVFTIVGVNRSNNMQIKS